MWSWHYWPHGLVGQSFTLGTWGDSVKFSQQLFWSYSCSVCLIHWKDIVSSFDFSTDIQNYDSSQTHFSIKVPYSFIPSFSVVLWSCQVNKIKLTNEFRDWSHLFVFLNLKRIMIKKNLKVIDIVLIYSFGSVNSQFSYWFITFYNAN